MTLTHGQSYRREYRAWVRMWQRVRANPKHPDYKTYVLKGVTAHPTWASFEVFFRDVGPMPSPRHSLDRYPNPSGNYEPGNVRWATWTEQQNNKTTNKRLSFHGCTRTVAEWARVLGVRADTLNQRLRAGWGVERTLATPVRKWLRG